MQSRTTVNFKVKDGVIVPVTPGDKTKYDIFKNNLKEGSVFEAYFTLVEDESDATLSQLAKVHANIREIARHTGHTFEEIKTIVKNKAGLYDYTNSCFISFAKCSKEQLSEAIQVTILLGDELGYNLN